MIRLTTSELKRYMVKWFLAGIVGTVLFLVGITSGSYFWGIPGLVLISASSFGFFSNLGVLVKRKIKKEV